MRGGYCPVVLPMHKTLTISIFTSFPQFSLDSRVSPSRNCRLSALRLFLIAFFFQHALARRLLEPGEAEAILSVRVVHIHADATCGTQLSTISNKPHLRACLGRFGPRAAQKRELLIVDPANRGCCSRTASQESGVVQETSVDLIRGLK